MKKQLLTLSVIALCFSVTLISCQKDNDQDETDDTLKQELSVHSDDQSQFSTEMDALTADVDIALESNPTLMGRFEGAQGLICDATVAADLVSNPMTVTITYDGTNCLGNRTRTGKIVLSVPQGTKWKNAGAAVSVNIQNLKITRVRDNKSITINGTQTYTNVSGGLLLNLASLQQIVHTVSSDGISVSFDNGTQRNWKVGRKHTFTYSNGVVITSTGTHTIGNQANIAEWGTNRFGQEFSTAVLEPIVQRQDCNFRVGSGQLQHKNQFATATATYGLNATGAPTTCPGSGNYYYKLVWTGRNGNSFSVILPY